MEAEFGSSYNLPKAEKGKYRTKRANYYSILEMADVDMKSSYMLRPADTYKAQLAEDEIVENYWNKKFQYLGRDIKSIYIVE